MGRRRTVARAGDDGAFEARPGSRAASVSTPVFGVECARNAQTLQARYAMGSNAVSVRVDPTGLQDQDEIPTRSCKEKLCATQKCCLTGDIKVNVNQPLSAGNKRTVGDYLKDKRAKGSKATFGDAADKATSAGHVKDSDQDVQIVFQGIAGYEGDSSCYAVATVRLRNSNDAAKKKVRDYLKGEGLPDKEIKDNTWYVEPYQPAVLFDDCLLSAVDAPTFRRTERGQYDFKICFFSTEQECHIKMACVLVSVDLSKWPNVNVIGEAPELYDYVPSK